MLRNHSGAILLAAVSWAVPATAQPSITAVLNAASFQTGVPRGCVVSIFGSGLAQTAAQAGGVPLPTKLADAVVTVGVLEIAAPLYFVSPGQINAQIPFEALGNPLPVFVTTSAGKSKAFLLTPSDSGPGVFTRSGDGKGPAVILGPNFQPLDLAAAGSPMIFYATGLGPTDPPALSGTPGAGAEPLNRAVNVPDVFVGDFPARVDFAGLAPGMAGVYQLNVVPQQIGSDRLFIRSQGRTSNVAAIGSLVAPGRSVSNASGTIQALYPTTDPNAFPIAYTPLLVVVKFTARMDILPSAGPFVIAATSDAATSIITVDPVNGTYDGSVTVPAVPPRFGDFSNTEFQAIDFLTCSQMPGSSVTCQPFPGNILPANRIPALELQTVSTVPLPDTAIPHSATGLLKVRGAAKAGSTFVIDGQNNSSLSVFGGYLAIPVPPKSGTTTLKLFIDGKLVASTEAPYRVQTF